ncbi:hypothetical protein [Streptomyces sp. NPDC093707]|uniref:hypothetical protein n=1 Tax=Streptomyces sp. NPDC093707 TaxID=3154984 RepID=UPI00344F2B52
MPESPGGRVLVVEPSAVVETIGTRQRRLAALLADMVPGARTIRVSQRQPGQKWPSPYAHAYDARGRLIALNRAQRTTVARWVIRAHPDMTRDETYDLDLATGTLRPAVAVSLAIGGGC